MSIAGIASEATAPTRLHDGQAPSTPATGDTDAMDITPSIEHGPTADVLQSQPMTATTSSASHNPTQVDVDSEAATYGTRSRNKGGNSRPNYADDRELDLEIEAAGRLPKSKPKKEKAIAASSNVLGAQDEPLKATAPQNAFAAVNSAGIINSVPPIPGTSTFSTQQQNNKRKQPGVTSAAAPSPGAPAQAKKTRGVHSTASRLHLETNMLIFSRCRGRLNAKKQLVADDGTTLAANGEDYIPNHTVHTNRTCRPCLLCLRTSRRTVLSCSNYGVPACKLRARLPHRRGPGQLVLSTERHPTTGPRYQSCVCVHALRHLSSEFTAREVQYSASLRDSRPRQVPGTKRLFLV
jgi:hypothetical protein